MPFALFNALHQTDPGSDDAFAALAAGNQLRQAGMGYDIAADIQHFAELEAMFVPLTPAHPAPPPAGAPRPVFIVGLPRSGTTLTERILAAAPGVHGAGASDTRSTARSMTSAATPPSVPGVTMPDALRWPPPP